MPLTIHEIFNSLNDIRWNSLIKTYGNNHSSIIGFFTNWWNNLDDRNWSLESGPSKKLSNLKTGHCDALFCSGESPIGILEVEGSRYDFTITKIKEFLNSRQDYNSLEFGLLVLYGNTPFGTGSKRTFLKTISSNYSMRLK